MEIELKYCKHDFLVADRFRTDPNKVVYSLIIRELADVWRTLLTLK